MRFLELPMSYLAAKGTCRRRAEMERLEGLDEHRQGRATWDNDVFQDEKYQVAFIDQSSLPLSDFEDLSSMPPSTSSAESLSPSKPSNSSASASASPSPSLPSSPADASP